MRTPGRMLSIQTGRVQKFGGDSDNSESWTSATRKAKVPRAVQVQQTGIVGDEQADIVHHGGPDKAILAYAAQHYDRWNAEFPGKGFEFGENLTVADLDESGCCIGDTFQAGDCVLEISQPRQPAVLETIPTQGPSKACCTCAAERPNRLVTAGILC